MAKRKRCHICKERGCICATSTIHEVVTFKGLGAMRKRMARLQRENAELRRRLREAGLEFGT